MQLWCRTCLNPIVSVQHKNYNENTEVFRSFWSFHRKLKSFTLTIPWKSAELVKIFLLESLHVDTTQIRNKWDCWKKTVRKVKNCTSAVLLEWGPNESWWADSMECFLIFETPQISYRARNSICKTFGATISRTAIPFDSLVGPHLVSAQDQSRILQFGQKVSLGWNLEGRRTDRGPWGVGDDGRIGNLLEKTQCERSDISQTRRFYFSDRRWTNQNTWRRSGIENMHHGTASTNSRRKSHRFSLEH